MVRFKLAEPECWLKGFDEDVVYVAVEFDKEANQEITKQLYNSYEGNDIRACWISIMYDYANETLGISNAALEKVNPETGERVDDYPFGNSEWVKNVTFEFNQDELNYMRENLDEILLQAKENEKNAVYEEPSEWDYDYLR